MNHLFPQRLLVGVVVTAAIISQVINAQKVNVTTKPNKCKNHDAVKEVNITFTPSNASDCKYSFGCGKHEPDYPPCPPSQKKPQSVMSGEHRNDTCASSYGGSGRLGRSAKDGRCYRICDSCNRELINGSETIPDAEVAMSHTAAKSQSIQTCIEEKHTAEYLIEHSKKNVSNEGCKWKYKCKKNEDSTAYAEKAVGMRLKPSNENRIRVQLYCCKMNCSYNCTKDIVGSTENQTIVSRLSESEVITEIQVQRHEKKDGLEIRTVVLSKCSECPPGLSPPKDPPAIPVPVLAIGYGDDPEPIYNKCTMNEDCNENQACAGYCQPICKSGADCHDNTRCLSEITPAGKDGPDVCFCKGSGLTCGVNEECCTQRCNGVSCQAGDGRCKYDIECSQYFNKDGRLTFGGICVDGHCAAS